MYNPLALDLQRVEQGQLRTRAEHAARVEPDPTARPAWRQRGTATP
jgi:hypothetical protein